MNDKIIQCKNHLSADLTILATLFKSFSDINFWSSLYDLGDIESDSKTTTYSPIISNTPAASLFSHFLVYKKYHTRDWRELINSDCSVIMYDLNIVQPINNRIELRVSSLKFEIYVYFFWSLKPGEKPVGKHPLGGKVSDLLWLQTRLKRSPPWIN